MAFLLIADTGKEIDKVAFGPPWSIYEDLPHLLLFLRLGGTAVF